MNEMIASHPDAALKMLKMDGKQPNTSQINSSINPEHFNHVVPTVNKPVLGKLGVTHQEMMASWNDHKTS